MDRAEAVALLAAAPVVHVAGTSAEHPAGAPVLRTVHGVVVDDAVAFHGAPVGEKTEAVGREVVVSAEETVAQVPSYFVDPERACPATTFYRAVQVHGVLAREDDPERKARVLAALMTKFQPEGGHVPIAADHPLYRKAIAGIMVLRVSLERLDGKAKLGQNRTPAERAAILARLWARGGAGDAAAIERVRAANPSDEAPEFLRSSVPGVTLTCAPGLRLHDAAQAVALLGPEYWNAGVEPERIARALAGSSAWVGARAASGELVATARAVSDGAKNAWVYDVAVARALRGRGLGRAVVELLLAHPAVRDARTVWLGTRDAQRLYRRLGFVTRAELPPKGYVPTEMCLQRT